MNPTNEPVTFTETVKAAVLALIGATTAFHLWTPTPEQIGAVLGLLAAVFLVGSFVLRGKVTPVSNPKTTKAVPLVESTPLPPPPPAPADPAVPIA